MGTIISWTDETWNPVSGCSKISEGCRNCYAERISNRYGWTKLPWLKKYADQNIICHESRLGKPFKFKTPKKIFVNSMSDLFHENVPDEFIKKIFKIMNELPQHTFQILTKRSKRMAEWPGPWGQNILMGVSIENRKSLFRLNDLKRCNAKIKFISFEPLLEKIGPINLSGIDWVIVGGESGPNFRPMDHAWAREIRDNCVQNNIPFFFKQSAAYRTEIGTFLEEKNGTKTKWNQYPIQFASSIRTA